MNKLGLSQAKLSPSLSQILNWNFNLQAETENRSLKLKFEVEIWIWRFGVGEVENDKATNKKTQIKFEKHRRRKKLVQTSQILTPMLTIIQQRKIHAYKIAYLGIKSRTLIRELIPIIGFFLWRGTVDPVHIQYHQKLKPQTIWMTDGQAGAELDQAQS